MKNKDIVNHPDHYTRHSIEVIDVIENWELDYREGNIIKYVARYKYKNGLEDLKKARWYLERIILNYGKENEHGICRDNK